MWVDVIYQFRIIQYYPTSIMDDHLSYFWLTFKVDNNLLPLQICITSFNADLSGSTL